MKTHYKFIKIVLLFDFEIKLYLWNLQDKLRISIRILYDEFIKIIVRSEFETELRIYICASYEILYSDGDDRVKFPM